MTEGVHAGLTLGEVVGVGPPGRLGALGLEKEKNKNRGGTREVSEETVSRSVCRTKRTLILTNTDDTTVHTAVKTANSSISSDFICPQILWFYFFIFFPGTLCLSTVIKILFIT